jgi:hypothetical protein
LNDEYDSLLNNNITSKVIHNDSVVSKISVRWNENEDRPSLKDTEEPRNVKVDTTKEHIKVEHHHEEINKDLSKDIKLNACIAIK